jgi:hypothetical protein
MNSLQEVLVSVLGFSRRKGEERPIGAIRILSFFRNDALTDDVKKVKLS